ncbi:MAG TPA: arginine--tRNA ligase [Nitrosopumilaceae archaeon]|nr:arginine--tRNA ligase [Nitrosopumilaceae archaeon]
MTFRLILAEIESNIKEIIAQHGFQNVEFVVELAKPGFGDFTCNVAFLLAKQAGKKPYDIAQQFAEDYKKHLGDYLAKAEAHKSGYLNFYSNQKEVNNLIIKSSLEKDYGFIDIGKKKSIIVEHTSVNPNKALHVGHIRNLVIGDTVVRILKKTNHDVKVLNYVDDSGLQVADIIVGFKYGGFSESPPAEQKFDHYCGDEVYVKTTEKYEVDKQFAEYRQKVLQDLENPNSELAKFASVITRKVLAEQLKTCWKMGVYYDCLNFESQIIHSKLWEKIFEMLKKMNLIKFEKEGKNKDCWVVEAQGEEDKVLVRSNGVATYIAKDIPYATWKLGIVDDPFYYKKYSEQSNGTILWETTLEKNNNQKLKFSGQKVITVIDSRQARLQKIITNLIAKLKPEKDAYSHLSYESVTLSADTVKAIGHEIEGKQAQMSGRKGVYINADEVIESLEKRIFEEAKKRNDDLDSNILSKIATDVAVGTLRYEMIKQDLDKIITFDLKKSLSLEGDTCSYLQYSFARASRILEKAGFEPKFDSLFELLSTDHEVNLLKMIAKFDICINDAANNLSPKVIARFCYDLAVSFNSFYEHVPVLDNENKDLVNQRLCLVYCFKSTLEKSLELLGIATPQRM